MVIMDLSLGETDAPLRGWLSFAAPSSCTEAFVSTHPTTSWPEPASCTCRRFRVHKKYPSTDATRTKSPRADERAIMRSRGVSACAAAVDVMFADEVVAVL